LFTIQALIFLQDQPLPYDQEVKNNLQIRANTNDPRGLERYCHRRQHCLRCLRLNHCVMPNQAKHRCHCCR